MLVFRGSIGFHEPTVLSLRLNGLCRKLRPREVQHLCCCKSFWSHVAGMLPSLLAWQNLKYLLFFLFVWGGDSGRIKITRFPEDALKLNKIFLIFRFKDHLER